MNDSQFRTLMMFLGVSMCVLLGGTALWASRGRDDDGGERYSARRDHHRNEPVRRERAARSHHDND